MRPEDNWEVRLICQLELRIRGGMWFGSSKERKAIHMEMKKANIW